MSAVNVIQVKPSKFNISVVVFGEGNVSSNVLEFLMLLITILKAYKIDLY